MAIGRINGPMLYSNLERNGVDIAIDGNLLYFDVTQRRIGVNNAAPTEAFDVSSNVKIAGMSMGNSTITSNVGRINVNSNASINGTLTLNSAISSPELRSVGFTTASTSQVIIDSWSTTVYRSSKYLCQITSGSAYHMIELNLLHDGTTAYLAQYGEIKTGVSLGTFDASISAGIMRVQFTPTNAITTVKCFYTLIPI